MAQNMAVSVTLRLQDQFTQPVRALMRQLQGLTRAAQEFNRNMGGTGASNNFARFTNDARMLGNEVRDLVGQFNRLGRAMTGGTTSGSFAQRQVSDLRHVLQLQQQIISNNNRMLNGPAGVPRGSGGLGGGIWGRRSFSPNASIADRIQYRAVNFGEQSLISGALDLDRARTALAMLAVPRRDPNKPDQLLPGMIAPEVVGQAEAAATELSQSFRVLNCAHILDTFREIVTQFENVEDAFKLLPELLHMQEWHVLMGDTVPQARAGMLSMLRAIGLSGRLINNNGRLAIADPNDPSSPILASQFIDTYLRARMVGGADVTPDQVFQVMKYLKASGQSLDMSALLTTFIAMPDIRGSTFGNQLNMLVRGLTGGATQAALQAAQRAGLGTITERTVSGPHGFQVADEVMLRSNPFAWFAKHIIGPQGVLARAGLDPNTATQAQIATALRPIFSNQSAENIANMIVGQWREWMGQTRNSLRANLTAETRQSSAAGSGWHGLQTARSSLLDALGAVAENFKSVLLPAVNDVSDSLKTLGRWLDPRTGHADTRWAVLGAGGFAAFLAARNMWRGMGPLGRGLVGGSLGFLMGGGPTDFLMGALMGRGFGGSGAAAAAGAAGAAAAQTWGSRFLGVIGRIARIAGGMLVMGLAGYVLSEIISYWDTFKERMLAIFNDIRKAAPTWLGGEGHGWGAIAGGGGIASLDRGIASLIDNLGVGTVGGLTAVQRSELARLTSDTALFGMPGEGAAPAPGTAWWQWHPPTPWDMWQRLWGTTPPSGETAGATTAGKGTIQSITTGPINVTVNVTQSNASPQAIGEAAGNAVRSGLRGAISDAAPMP